MSSSLLNIILWTLTLSLLVVVLILLKRSIILVWPTRAIIYERRGRFVRVIKTPGLHLVSPVFRSLHPVSIRTEKLDLPPMNLFSGDRKAFTLKAFAYFRVVDPKKAYYYPEYYMEATKRAVQRSIKDTASRMDLEEIYCSRKLFSSRAREGVEKECERWGVKVEEVGIEDVLVRDPEDKLKLEEMYNDLRRTVVKVLYE